MPPPAPSALVRFVHRIGRISAQCRRLIGLALGALAWVLAPAGEDNSSRSVAAWNVCAGSTLLISAAAMLTADAARIRKVASSEDLSRMLAFAFVLVAAVASLMAVVALLGTLGSLSGGALTRHVALSVAAGCCSHLTINIYHLTERLTARTAVN